MRHIKKTGDMTVGQVSFHTDKRDAALPSWSLRILGETRCTPLLNMRKNKPLMWSYAV